MKYLCWLLIIPVMVGVSRRIDRFDLSKSCVTHYKMNDNADSNDVIDSRGYSTGISQRNTSVVHTDGKVGGALAFNGTTDYVDTDDTFQSTFQDSFSVNLWALFTDGLPPATSYGLIATKNEIPTKGEVWIEALANGGLSLGLFVEVGSSISTSVDPGGITVDGATWSMITMVANKISDTTGNMLVYVNGELIRTGSVGNVVFENFVPASNLWIGKSAVGFFNGDIDNVTIFNKALSSNEIKWLYKNGHGRENLAQGRRLK